MKNIFDQLESPLPSTSRFVRGYEVSFPCHPNGYKSTGTAGISLAILSMGAGDSTAPDSQDGGPTICRAKCEDKDKLPRSV